MSLRVPKILLALPLYYPQARRLREGAMSAAQRHGEWQLIDCDPTQLHANPALLENADGVIISTGVDAAWLPAFAARGVPIVNCNEYWLNTPGVSTVAVEWESLAELAIGHFQQCGVGNVAYVGGDIGEGEALFYRVELMKRLVSQQGGELRVCALDRRETPRDIDVPVKTKVDQQLAAFLRKAPKPIGALCDDDALAAKMCLVAQRIGLRIPQDVAVIGQGDRLVGQTARPALTTIVPPGVAMGRKAAELLCDRLHGRTAPHVTWVPCTELIVRGSTVAVAGGTALERAWRQLEGKALQGITIQELSDIAECSPKTFRRRFHLQYGIDPAEEIRRLRFEEACRLLLETKLSVSEVGSRCGFPSASNFFNFFRRHASCGPAEYRIGEKGSA